MNILKLKHLMVDKGITQLDLAKYLELSPSTVSEKMRGNIKFSLSEVSRMAKLFNVDINIFLN